MPDAHKNKLKAALVALAAVAGGVFGLPFTEEDATAGTEVGAAAYAAVAAVIVWGKSILDKLTGGA